MKKGISLILMGVILSVALTGCALLQGQNNKPIGENREDWFEENGYTINEEGEYEFRTYVNYTAPDLTKTPVALTLEGNVQITEIDNGDGTKTITAEFIHAPYEFADAWGTASGYYFAADRYTGTVYINGYYGVDEPFSIKYDDGIKVEMTANWSKNTATSANMNKIDKMVVVAPINYNGVVFGFMGTKVGTLDDIWQKTLNVKELEIEDENCDLLFFANSSQDNDVPLAEKENEKDWFEKNGYAINEAGEFDFSTYVTYEKVTGQPIPKNVSFHGTAEITETDNGDGTKTVEAVFTYPPHIFGELDQNGVSMWSTATGYFFAADRYTGTAFINTGYFSEESFVATYENGDAVECTVYRDKNTVKSEDMNKVESVRVTVPSDYDGVVFGYMGVRDGITDQAFWGRSYSVKELRRQDENCDLIFWAK